MSGTYNKAIVIGRLGRDPELRYTQNGTPVAQLSLASNEAYTDREGNHQERTEWHRVVVWNKQAENAAKHLAKGRLVLIEGPLQTRSFQDKNGVDRYVTEIRASRLVFMPDGKGSSIPSPTDEDAPPGDSQSNGPAFPQSVSGMDEAPF
jgi:single-strand DNA-binding protein